MNINTLTTPEFLVHVKRTCTNDPHIQFYVNYLEQVTLDYWEDQTLDYPIRQLYFEQTYPQILELFQENQDLEVKQYSSDYIFEFYDKLSDLYPLKLQSNYLIAFAMQYHNIYRILPQQLKKDLSDKRERLIASYTQQDLRTIKSKVKISLQGQNLTNISYALFYDLYKVDILKNNPQGYHQMLDLADEAIIEHLEDQYKVAQQKQMSEKKKLLAKNSNKDINHLKLFKTNTFMQLQNMRMKNPEFYIQFAKSYLQFK